MLADFHSQMLNKLSMKTTSAVFTLNDAVSKLRKLGVPIDQKLTAKMRQFDQVYKICRHLNHALLDQTLLDIDGIFEHKFEEEKFGQQSKAADENNNITIGKVQAEDVFGASGKHVHVAYSVKPKADRDSLAIAALFAAGASQRTDMNVHTTDDFLQSIDPKICFIDPDKERNKIAYPNVLLDRPTFDRRSLLCSALTRMTGNNQGIADPCLRRFDGPETSILGKWRTLGCSITIGGLFVGSIFLRKCAFLWNPHQKRGSLSGWVVTSSSPTSPRATICLVSGMIVSQKLRC